MTFETDKDGDRRRKTKQKNDSEDQAESGLDKKKKRPVPEVGNALRSAYERTVAEDIPPEMLDLLGKLG